jgi:hypothetical protein
LSNPFEGSIVSLVDLTATFTEEHRRLHEDRLQKGNWKRWGPYLSERQWGTVREDYSVDGAAWQALPHDHARSRAYRWGEDGLLGICDRQCRVCFAPAFWNHRDPILKERLFGLTGPEGNHAEDVKELYYYLDGTPTHSYMKALYKYPQATFPYTELVRENGRRGLRDAEYDLVDTGVFNDGRYFDVTVEYAKAGPEDLVMRLTVENRGPEAAPLDVLPTLWFRNTWDWTNGAVKPSLWLDGGVVKVNHTGLQSTLVKDLGEYEFHAMPTSDGTLPEWLFTENETNRERLYGQPSSSAFTKDAFHRHIIQGEADAVNPERRGTKVAAHYRLLVPGGGRVSVEMRLCRSELASVPSDGAAVMAQRLSEADAFYATLLEADPAKALVQRQAHAGLLWSKQFYHYVVKDWLEGDETSPAPPASRLKGRNKSWRHLFAKDILSMPDKWEYPWFAAWDTAFHMLPMAETDPDFAKEQMLLFLREWYMHPNGQIPAYEWAFSDVNPPVHAWACWRIYKIAAAEGERDREFLDRCFQKLVLNFTWWVNRKDSEGRNLFAGGFLGLDNIGLFDRNQPLPNGQRLEQADGTAWMAFYALTMLNMALELARLADGSISRAHEDMASKFFEHFVEITDAVNTLGGHGLWNEEDGFYYDQILDEDKPPIALRTRSLVGLLPLIAVELLDEARIEALPGFKKRMDWFLQHRSDLARHTSFCPHSGAKGLRLLAVPSRERLLRLLKYLLDESEFLSDYGIRSLSRYHLQHPFTLQLNGTEHTVRYAPGDSDTHTFGGNSNWRGPIWFPIAYLIIEALERYHHFYGESFTVELPTGSGQQVNLLKVAQNLAQRMSRLFLPDESGFRPCHGADARYAHDPAWKDLVLFHEFFHGDSGLGCGASHQTGWTALVARLMRKG